MMGSVTKIAAASLSSHANLSMAGAEMHMHAPSPPGEAGAAEPAQAVERAVPG